MKILLFLFSAGTIGILLSSKKKESLNPLIWAVLGGLLITVLGTSEVCFDGWISESIGIQGACSYHGGVVSRLNGIGWIVFFSSIAVVIGHFYKPGKTSGEKASREKSSKS